MNKIFKLIFNVSFIIFVKLRISSENFFDEALKIYQDKKYEDARFLFERNIVFNPKMQNHIFILAKIYNHEEDQRKEEYNLRYSIVDRAQ